MAGDVDYMLRVAVSSIQDYDGFYKRLIAAIPLKNVTSRFAMERIKQTTALPIPAQEALRPRGASTILLAFMFGGIDRAALRLAHRVRRGRHRDHAVRRAGAPHGARAGAQRRCGPARGKRAGPRARVAARPVARSRDVPDLPRRDHHVDRRLRGARLDPVLPRALAPASARDDRHLPGAGDRHRRRDRQLARRLLFRRAAPARHPLVALAGRRGVHRLKAVLDGVLPDRQHGGRRARLSRSSPHRCGSRNPTAAAACRSGPSGSSCR